MTRPEERDDPHDRVVAVRMGASRGSHAGDVAVGLPLSHPGRRARAGAGAPAGIGSRVVLGAKATPEFSAHAWVEHRGVPLLPHRGYAAGRLTEL